MAAFDDLVYLEGDGWRLSNLQWRATVTGSVTIESTTTTEIEYWGWPYDKGVLHSQPTSLLLASGWTATDVAKWAWGSPGRLHSEPTDLWLASGFEIRQLDFLFHWEQDVIFLGFGGVTPSKPAAGMAAWWDADALQAEDGALAEWPDRANGYDLAQADGTLQPELISGAVNGRQAVHFDGSKQLDLPTNVIPREAREQGQAIFVVVAPDHWDQPSDAWIYREEDDDGDGHRSVGLVSYSQRQSGQQTGDSLHSGAFDGDELVIYEVHHLLDERDRLVLYGNGEYQESNAYTDDVTTALALVGEDFSGHICEVIIYNRGLTEGDRRDTYRYLKEKWGLRAPAPVYAGADLIGKGFFQATLSGVHRASFAAESTSGLDADLWKGNEATGRVAFESTTGLDLAHTLIAGGAVRAASSTAVQADGRIALHRVSLTLSSTSRLVADGRVSLLRAAAVLESTSGLVADGRVAQLRASASLVSTSELAADGRSAVHHVALSLVSTSEVIADARSAIAQGRATLESLSTLVASGRIATQRGAAILVSTDELTADGIVNSILAGAAALASTTRVALHGSLVTETEEETTEVTVREPSVRKRSQRAAF